jgi:transcriptional regulator with XRE-family HTH domain
MLTPFGKFVRKLRIDRGLRLKDMADSLGLSSAFLSAVETGSKPMPATMADQVCRYFGLDPQQQSDLRMAVDASQVEARIRMVGLEDQSRELVAAFARRIGGLEPSQREKILDILKEK